jgi:hypothetical protein
MSFFVGFEVFFRTAQWDSFSKKLQKLIILAPVHIFLFPIQGKDKIARGIRITKFKLILKDDCKRYSE